MKATKNQTAARKTLISIPGAGYFICSGNKSSKCFATSEAALAAKPILTATAQR